jgi:hypothetical protein
VTALRRPALGAVLDALTTWEGDAAPPSLWLTRGRFVDLAVGRCVLRSPAGGFGWRYPWTTTDPAEAWELLQARDLIPLAYVGRFVCEVCADPSAKSARRVECANGVTPHLPTVAALASWASLGFAAHDDGTPGILGAEELAGAMSPDAPVWWRVSQPGADASQAYRSESPARRLVDAGLGWRRRATHTALYVAPLWTEAG